MNFLLRVCVPYHSCRTCSARQPVDYLSVGGGWDRHIPAKTDPTRHDAEFLFLFVFVDRCGLTSAVKR